jgi:hypothetical protein
MISLPPILDEDIADRLKKIILLADPGECFSWVIASAEVIPECVPTRIAEKHSRSECVALGILLGLLMSKTALDEFVAEVRAKENK